MNLREQEAILAKTSTGTFYKERLNEGGGGGDQKT